MNVALTFNVKPDSETFPEFLSPNMKKSLNSENVSADMFAEWDTWDTINAVKAALECYSNVTLVEADYKAPEKLIALKPDIVFNIAEGMFGLSREAQIPAILDMLGIPYTGSDPLTLSICLDKIRTKEILSYYKIPNAKFIKAESIEDLKQLDLSFPLIVKPSAEGSSKGIFSSSFVSSNDELLKEVEKIVYEYNQPALVEEYLPGREFTVAIIGNGNNAEVLPIVEINYNEFPEDALPIYSYEAKWILDTKDNPLNVFSCPANVDDQLEQKIKATALNGYKALNCKDWSRIDIRLDKNGVPNIIEINPLPGILPDPKENSCFPKAAFTKGYSYNEMINKVLEEGAKRYNLI